MAKIGQGHASAMARLGLKELRNAFNPSRESVADTELGLYGAMTQGEIADAREDPTRAMNTGQFEPERLEDVLRPRERPQPDSPDNDGPEPDNGMER